MKWSAQLSSTAPLPAGTRMEINGHLHLQLTALLQASKTILMIFIFLQLKILDLPNAQKSLLRNALNKEIAWIKKIHMDVKLSATFIVNQISQKILMKLLKLSNENQMY